MLAATIAFVSVVSCLNQQAFGRAKQFHEKLFIHSGRAGGYRVCNAVNRKRERQTDDASSYASSHAPSHASPRQDVTGKMAPSLGPFFLSSFVLFLSLGLQRAAVFHGVLVPGALRLRMPFDVSPLVTLPSGVPQLSAWPQRSAWLGR